MVTVLSGPDSYTQDGVDIIEGDKFSALAGRICRDSFGNSPYVKVSDYAQDQFRGPRGFQFVNLPEGYIIDGAPDGIGTKVVIIDKAGTHRRAINDLMAMTLSDLMRYGGLPLVFFNILDVKSLGQEGDSTNTACREMIIGAGEAAREQQVVLFRGETAEIGSCVGSDNSNPRVLFNWGGMVIGVYHPDNMIRGDSLKPGQVVMALRELGFRSNGISSVRAAFARHYGEDWFNNPKAQEDIKNAAEPSVLYNRFLSHLNGWDDPGTLKPVIKMHLISHLSGGGIQSKFFDDMLKPRGLSAELFDLWEPPKIMIKCAKWRGMTDEECYRTWNGGQGTLVVIDSSDVEKFISIASEYHIEAKLCGEILGPKVSILSKFSGEQVVYS